MPSAASRRRATASRSSAVGQKRSLESSGADDGAYTLTERRPEYIDVQWRHRSDADPTRLVSELDEQRMETRKLEFFEDGRVGYAWADHTAHGTELGLAPVPPLTEINADPEFVGTTITAADFDALWLEHVPMPHANTADEATLIWERTRSR